MRYNAVHEFDDTDHTTYNALKFRLLLNAPANPANKDGVIVPKKTKTIWRQEEDKDEDEDEDDDNEEEDNFVTPSKCNKPTVRKCKHKKRKATINPDLVFGAVVGANEVNKVNNDENQMTMADPKKYTVTKILKWMRCNEGEGRVIKPVPCTTLSELFDIKLEDDNLDKMHNGYGTICFHLLFDWLLPKFGEGLDEMDSTSLLLHE
jgi:hypothetical protein